MVDVLRAYAGRVQEVAEDLLATGRHNRDSLAAIVGLEVDRALERVGLATADEVRQLTDRVRDLEATVRDLRDDLAAQQRAGRAPSRTDAGKPAGARGRTTTPRKTSATGTATSRGKTSTAKRSPSGPAKQSAGGAQA